MRDEDYRALPGVNWSTLKEIDKSPKHYKHGLESEREDTAAFRFGRAVHCLVLEPGEFDSRYVIWDGGRRYGKKWDRFQTDYSDSEILSENELYRAKHVAASVNEHPVAHGLLRQAVDREQVVQWTDSETGIDCKAKLDAVGSMVIDLKTTQDVSPIAFGNSAAKYGYHGQCAFYHDGAVAAGYELTKDPVLIVVESVEPYDVAVYTLPDYVLDIGRMYYRRLLRQLHGCQQSGVFPGVCSDTMVLSLPGWVEEQEMNAAAEFGSPEDMELISA